MPDFTPRTDLAVEAGRVRRGASAIDGVFVRETEKSGFRVTTVEIRSPAASKELCKPIGVYHTVALDPVLRREDAAFSSAASLLAELIRDLLPLKKEDAVLVVGLGNRAITPDAVGPRAAEFVLATRHLRAQLAEAFSDLRPVAVLAPGVLGSTGVESAQMVHALAQMIRPAALIAIDALACAEPERLCRTVQITNTGITPGSGVQNAREKLNSEAFGVPVIAVGVPTVMDIRTVSTDPTLEGMFVTPRDIDTTVSDFSKLTAYAVNLALHDGLDITDLDMLLC